MGLTCYCNFDMHDNSETRKCILAELIHDEAQYSTDTESMLPIHQH